MAAGATPNAGLILWMGIHQDDHLNSFFENNMAFSTPHQSDSKSKSNPLSSWTNQGILSDVKTCQLLEKLALIYERADSATARIKAKHPELIPCRPGCTDCCYAVFDVSLAEGIFIALTFTRLDRHIRRKALKRARKAIEAWNRLIKSGEDISKARVRCPLLSDEGLCICYEARPVNCRTYGVPTAFQGRAHVCGLTGFEQGRTYTTLDLDPIHRALFELSKEVLPLPQAAHRMPVAGILESARTLAGLVG